MRLSLVGGTQQVVDGFDGVEGVDGYLDKDGVPVAHGAVPQSRQLEGAQGATGLTLVGDEASNIQKQLSIFKKIKEEQLIKIEDETLVLGAHLEGSFLSPNKSGIQDKSVFDNNIVNQ